MIVNYPVGSAEWRKKYPFSSISIDKVNTLDAGYSIQIANDLKIDRTKPQPKMISGGVTAPVDYRNYAVIGQVGIADFGYYFTYDSKSGKFTEIFGS